MFLRTCTNGTLWDQGTLSCAQADLVDCPEGKVVLLSGFAVSEFVVSGFVVSVFAVSGSLNTEFVDSRFVIS